MPALSRPFLTDLRALGLSLTDAVEIRAQMGGILPRALLHSVSVKLSQHGVEYLPANTDSKHVARGVEYVNTGDPYRATLMYDYGQHAYVVGCWGDLAESDERFADRRED